MWIIILSTLFYCKTPPPLPDSLTELITHAPRDGCSRSSNKVLRGLTKRPAFMDSHIESLFNIKGILSKGIPEGDHVDVKVC